MDEHEAGSGSGAVETLCTDLTEATFNSHDVVLGKGNGINCLPGNQLFRSIINKYKPMYARTPRNEKGSIAELVINEIASLDPPGRFLEPQADNKRFKEVSRRRALEKTCQALREKKNNLPPSQMHPPLQSAAMAPLTRKVSPAVAGVPSPHNTADPPHSFAHHPYPPCYGMYASYPVHPIHPVAASDTTGRSPGKVCMEEAVKGEDDADADRSRAEEQGTASESTEMDVTARELLTLKDEEEGNLEPVWPLMDNDVLYGGRGRKHFHRVANQRFLDLIKYSRQEYQTSRSKKRVALRIISQWRRQSPAGRFLQQNSKDNKWYEIPQSKILEKACQALRDLKRERGPGGERPSSISDRLVDPRSGSSGQQQQPIQPPNTHLYPYHPRHLGMPQQRGRWMGPYPPPGMIYGNPFIPFPGLAPPVGGSTDSELNRPPMMYHNGFTPMQIPGGPVPSPKKPSAGGDEKGDDTVNSVPTHNMMYYGNGFIPHYPMLPTMAAGATSPSPPNGVSGNRPQMMYGAGYFPPPQQYVPITRSSPVPPINNKNNGEDDAKKHASLSPSENQGTPTDKQENHGPQQQVAAIQRQASIVAQEMKKMDELVRRASSSGVYVPPAGFASPNSALPLAAAAATTTTTTIHSDSKTGQSSSTEGGVAALSDRKSPSEGDAPHNETSQKPETTAASRSDNGQEKDRKTENTSPRGDTKTVQCTWEAAGPDQETAQEVPDVEVAYEKEKVSEHRSENEARVEDTQPEEETNIPQEVQSAETSKCPNDGKSKDPSGGIECTDISDESRYHDNSDKKTNRKGDIEAATLLVNMLG